MSSYEIWLILHLIGVVLLAGGHVASIFVINVAGATDRTSEHQEYEKTLKTLDSKVIGLANILIIVPGLILVHVAGYSYGDGWVIAAYVLLALIMAAIFGLVEPAMKTYRNELKNAVESGEQSDAALPTLLKEKSLWTGVHLASAGILLFIVLMVTKPGF